MISTRHSLDDARVFHKEAKSLAGAGHEVLLVLTCNDKYEYSTSDGKTILQGIPPDGEAWYAGIRVLGRPKRSGLFGKYLNYLELGRLAGKQEADVYHAHEPDLSLAIAVRAKRLSERQGRRAMIVHDMHEYPPGESYDRIAGLLKVPVLLGHFLWDKLLMRRVDFVVTANSIVRGYSLVLSPTTGVEVLYNGPSLKLFMQGRPKRWNGSEERLILCHEGSLPFDRGLREMIEAVDRMGDRVSLGIVGDVFGKEREWMNRQIRERKLEDIVTCTGWLPYEQVGEAVAQCHVGLILFRECMENRMAGPPNKLFNYMNAGLPVISVAFPEMRRIINEEKCGVMIFDQTVESIVSSLQKIIENPAEMEKMGEAGQQAIRERYSWEQMEKRLLSVYDELSGKLC